MKQPLASGTGEQAAIPARHASRTVERARECAPQHCRRETAQEEHHTPTDNACTGIGARLRAAHVGRDEPDGRVGLHRLEGRHQRVAVELHVGIHHEVEVGIELPEHQVVGAAITDVPCPPETSTRDPGTSTSRAPARAASIDVASPLSTMNTCASAIRGQPRAPAR
jgi:hypothetical protein